MNHWINQEQYPDPTAGEAIDRVLLRNPASPELMDDTGCRHLAAAVTAQAVKDYFAALRRPARDEKAARERAALEQFFLSERFRRLSGLKGSTLIRRIREEAGRP